MTKRFQTVLLALFMAGAAARLPGADVTVTGLPGAPGKRTVSITAISGPTRARDEFAAVLSSDLKRSGWFTPVDAAGATVAVSGEIRQEGAQQYRASVSVTSAGRGREEPWALTFPADKLRDAAHALSDFITEKAAGAPGMASSKILLVGRRGGGEPEIYQCDADGQRLRQITSDAKLCMSPAWFHRRNAFLYTSWHSGSPAVYMVDLDDNSRKLAAGYPGMNQGAAPSPDDTLMALTLSRSGGVDLWVRNFDTLKLSRVTASKGVNEASPAWSPDGANIVFASNEGGGPPTLYTMNVADKNPRRVLRGSAIREATAPEWSVNGKITFCGRSEGRYRIYLTDPSGVETKAVSPDDGADYEDPSWAPDARHIICTKTAGFKRALVILDTGGDPAQTLFTLGGEWYLPAWSRRNTPLQTL